MVTKPRYESREHHRTVTTLLYGEQRNSYTNQHQHEANQKCDRLSLAALAGDGILRLRLVVAEPPESWDSQTRPGIEYTSR